MKRFILLSFFLYFISIEAQTPFSPSSSATTNGSDWSTTKITPDNALDYPWEITYGPDDYLWVTERVGEKIVRVDPNAYTSSPSVMIDLSSKVANAKQGGLMGMAIHPALYSDITTTTNNYVYAAYTYSDGGLKLRIVRLVYDNNTNSLSEDTSLDANGTIIEGLPGSADHNSGRLIIGPDLKLYYTIGDQGANQFDYSCDPILSQVLPTSSTDYDNYPGKTLRLNLDGSIPSDNPILDGVQSHVYTYGHRNAQGIIFAADGTLFNSEHGAKVDDEINVVEEGKNYGWPEIAGYYDNMAYTYCNWSSLGGGCNAGSFSDHNCPAGAETATEYESYPTANDVPANFQPPIGTYNSTIATDPSGGWFTWPTVAPSSIDIHENGNIPGWGRSLLVTSLKKGTIYRAKLSANGDDVVGDVYDEWHSSNDRYRDLAISPDGLTIYAVTDNGGGTSGPSSTSGVSVANPGMIVKIEYVGALVSNPPVANCQDITVTLDSYGTASITASDINNGSTGGSAGIASLEIDDNTFDCSDVGETTEVTLTVTDNDGNESRCTATITVQPNASPSPFVAPALDDIVSNCSITVEAPTLINNACVEVTATTTDAVTYNPGESGTITWTFDDGTNTDTATQNVTVNTLAVPSSLNVVPSTTTANVSWDDISDVTFNVRYREVGASSWITETAFTNSIVISGLTLSTDYELQVNADCGTGESAYSSLVNFTTTAINYCDPVVAYYPDDFYMSNFQLSDSGNTNILSNSSNQNDDVNGYSDHTDDGLTIPNLRTGDDFNIEITLVNTHSWNKTSGHSIWIDFNQDGDFGDSGERVWGTTDGDDLFPHNSMITGSFTVPVSALSGNTRMRVASRTYWTPNDSCEMDYDGNNGGEYEDYTVNIFSGLLYSSSTWSPNPPSGLTATEDIFVLDGTFNVTSDINVNNVRVASGATLNIDKANSVTVNGNIVNNGEFVLNSDSNEFASLLVEGSVTGNLKYHRFVNSNTNGNDLIAPPVNGESFSDFTANNSNIYMNAAETLYLFGHFDKSTGDYLTYSTSDVLNLEAARGYRTASTNASTFTFNGSVKTDQADVAIANSGPAYQRWNLIGNPYTSYIKLSDFLAANMSEFETQTAGVYGYDANDGDGSNWEIWNLSYSDANPNALIAPGQGFFVSSKSGGGNITFTPSMRANGSSDDFIPGRSANTISYAGIKLSTSTNNFVTDFYITNNASLGLDTGYDAAHLGGVSSTFSIYSELAEGNLGESMAIQAIGHDDVSNNAIVPLGVNAAQGEQLTIGLVDSNITSNVYLEDAQTNTFTLLNTNDYTFTPSVDLTGVGRFYLRFENNALSVNETNLESIDILSNNALDQIIIKGLMANNTELSLFDIQGRKILTQTLKAYSTQNTLSTVNYTSGVYVVQLSDGNSTITKKVIVE